MLADCDMFKRFLEFTRGSISFLLENCFIFGLGNFTSSGSCHVLMNMNLIFRGIYLLPYYFLDIEEPEGLI